MCEYSLTIINHFNELSNHKTKYTLLNGISGAYAIRAVFYFLNKNETKYLKYLNGLKKLHESVLDLDSCELLYGRMGYISAFGFIQHFTKQSKNTVLENLQ